MNHDEAGEPMSSVDRAWLEMDRPNNPMVVSAIVELSGRGGATALARTIATRLFGVPRFRQYVDAAHRPPVWRTDPSPDRDYHVRICRMGSAAGQADLQRAIEAELDQELDRSRPLWRCTLFVRRRDQVTLLFRAHHAMADGVALMRVLLATSDHVPATPPAIPVPVHTAHEGPLGALMDRLDMVNTLLDKAQRFVVDDLAHPERIPGQLREAGDGVAAVARVLRLRDENPELLRRPLQGHRRVAWTRKLPLARLSAFAHEHGVSLNDIFLATLSGAFGDWLAEQDAGPDENQNLRVSIPVNLRGADDSTLGNHFGLVLVELPIGIVDPEERLRECARRMGRLRESGEARALLVGLGAAAHLPVTAERRVVEWVADKAVAVVSNLPGPQHALCIGGLKVDNVVFWPPATGEVGMGVSLISYAGHITMGVCADVGVLADPQSLADAFEHEVEQLCGALSTQRPHAHAPGRSPGDGAMSRP